MPDVKGYGLRDALFRLERLGLKVEVKGAGRVSSQSRKPGEKFERGQTILLLLGNVEDIPKAERADTLKADTAKVAKKREEPEDSELTPTLHDERKLKQAEKEKKKKEPEAPAPKKKEAPAPEKKKAATPPQTEKKKERSR